MAFEEATDTTRNVILAGFAVLVLGLIVVAVITASRPVSGPADPAITATPWPVTATDSLDSLPE